MDCGFFFLLEGFWAPSLDICVIRCLNVLLFFGQPHHYLFLMSYEV